MSYMDLNEFKDTFDRNTFIGFDQYEIENTSTPDLLMIRKPVYQYLKSTKLKKRNANFIDVFKRINKELRDRNVIKERPLKKVVFGLKKKIKLNEIVDTKQRDLKREDSTKDETSSSLDSNYNLGLSKVISMDSTNGESLVSNTSSTSNTRTCSIDIEIPGFLNDICIKNKNKTQEGTDPKIYGDKIYKLKSKLLIFNY